MSFDDAKKKIADEGIQRAGYSMCQTCIGAAQRRNTSWDADPLGMLMVSYQDRPQVNADLQAVADLLSTMEPVPLPVADELAARRKDPQNG